MKHFNSIALAAILSFVVGCASVTPGNDPVVVNAERIQTTAAESFNALFTTEGQNHAFIKAHTPQVAAGVNTLRVEGPRALDTLVAVTRAYKNNRSAENKANLLTAIAVVQELINQSKNYLGQIGGAEYGTDLILELLPLLVSGITNGIAAIHKIEEAWAVTTERTPEQEAQFDKYLADLKASPYWQQQD